MLQILPVLLILSLLPGAVEIEISAPCLPGIMQYFNVSSQTVGLSISLNLFGFAIAALIYGPLSDTYGRKPIMLLGNGILTIGAIACVVAPSTTLLLIARLMQGLGAATSTVIASAIIADTYPPNKAAILYGAMNAVFTVCMAISPIMGGLICQTMGWRGIWYYCITMFIFMAISLFFA